MNRTDHEIMQALLDDFLEGAVDAELAEALQRHLEECPQCRAEVESAAVLRARARSLPREMAPPRDLWAGIEARLRESERTEPVRQVKVIELAGRRGAPRQWGWLAAAAVVLVMLSSGATALMLRNAGQPAVAVRSVVPAAKPPVGLAAFSASEAQYRSTVEELRSEFEARRGRLSPETVATIEKNLQIIDQAIAESRAALAKDPNNADLPLMLSGVYQTKVELLQHAVQLSSRT
ncbi:MAG TPA: anti-sigma factor [Longimicrobiaceae bacterium]|nr:anti-sigma factor [Longimicrobiaceae bacterium]